MIVKLYAVVDRVSGVFDGPHKAINDAQFLRSFADAAVNTESQIGSHPEDFYVVVLGTFNDSTGEVTPEENGAKRIADALDFVKNDMEN